MKPFHARVVAFRLKRACLQRIDWRAVSRGVVRQPRR